MTFVVLRHVLGRESSLIAHGLRLSSSARLSLFKVVFVAWSLLQSSVAHAATADPCRATAAFARVTEKERAAISDMCARGTFDAKVVGAALSALEVAPSWQVALFLRLTPGLPNEPEASLEQLAADLTPNGRCRAARGAFVEDAKKRRLGEFVVSPLRPETITEQGCRAPTGPDRVFLVVAGHEGDNIRIAYQEPTAQWQARQVSRFIDVGGFRYFFTRVATGSRVVVRHASAGDLTPAAIHDVVLTTDFVTPAMRDENARYCLQFEGEGNTGLVLLNGDVVPFTARETPVLEESTAPTAGDDAAPTRSTAPAETKNYFATRRFVRSGYHNLLVLGADGKKRAEATISPEELKQDECVVRRFDLADLTASTLLITTEATCTLKGVVQPRIYYYAKNYLEATLPRTEVVRDMEPWAAAVNAIARLNESLQPLGQTPTGADRGRLGTKSIVRELAGELLRKGFKTAYIGNVSCGEGVGSPTFTFVVHRLDLAAAVTTDTDALRGTKDNPGVLVTQHETVTTIDDLRDLIRVPFARIMRRPYARLVTESRKRQIFREPSQLVELWAPSVSAITGDKPGSGPKAKLRVLRLDATQIETRCAEILRQRRLVSPQLATRRLEGKLVYLEEPRFPRSDEGREVPQQRRVELDVDNAATYLLDLEVHDGNETLSFTRGCVQVRGDETEPRYAAQIGVSPSITEVNSRLRGDGVYSYILAFVSSGRWRASSKHSWGLPFLFGYGSLERNARTPPSWNDVAGAHFEDDGTTSIAWKRRSLLLGVMPDLEIQFVCGIGQLFDPSNRDARDVPHGCSELANRFNFFARAGVLIDAGLIATDDVPPELLDFLDRQAAGNGLLDIDLTAMLQGGFAVRIGTSLDVAVGGQIGFLGFDDPIGSQPESIRFDGLLASGFLVELGYHP